MLVFIFFSRGSLLTRNLGDLVKKEYFVLDSEYLTTQLVVVPKYVLKYSPFLFIKKNQYSSNQKSFYFHLSSNSLSYIAWFSRTRERLGMNQVRSLLRMNQTLLGYGFKTRPNSHVLGTASSVRTISFINKQLLALKKPVWQEKIRLWCDSTVQSILLFSSIRKKKPKEGSAHSAKKIAPWAQNCKFLC